MSAYVVVNLDVTDPDMFNRYREAAMPLVMANGGKYLAVDFAPKDMDGQSLTVLAIVEFESVQAAEAFYNSPQYQEILGLRLGSTKGWYASSLQLASHKETTALRLLSVWHTAITQLQPKRVEREAEIAGEVRCGSIKPRRETAQPASPRGLMLVDGDEVVGAPGSEPISGMNGAARGGR